MNVQALFQNSAVPLIKKFTSLENIKYIHIGENPEKIMKELNMFSPEFIGSDPNILQQLAFLKYNGHGKDVSPTRIFSGGAMIDSYTRTYVEKAFDAQVMDAYGTTEGGPLAFECLEGSYHVHSDFVYLEFLDDEDNPVPYNTPGHLVVTKLYGGGTPIIRYKGIDDVVTPIETQCSCGITSEMIKQIDEVLDSLHPDMRQIAFLRFHEEMKCSEIAKIVNIPNGTVKSRLHNIRTKLKQKLEEYHEVT